MAADPITTDKSMALRLNRVVKALEKTELDALIAAAPENVVYLSGAYNPVRRLLPERPAIVLCSKDAPPQLMAAAVEEAFLRKQSVISDLRFYQGTTEAAVMLLADALSNQGLSAARLGVDLEGVSAHFYRELHRSVPNAEIEDATHLLAELRAVKSEDEIQFLRHAAQSTDYAEWTALDTFQAGWTENELGIYLRQALIAQGAETIAFLVLGSGVRGVAAHAMPSDAPIVAGEIVRLDMGGYFGGWASDLAKTACVAEPSLRQRRVYRTLRNLMDDHIARIRPHETAGELFDAVASDFRKAGLRFSAPHVGHGLGLSIHDWPILSAGNPAPIRSGMVISAELIYIERDRERYHLEELVAVRQEGAEVISRSRPLQDEIPVVG